MSILTGVYQLLVCMSPMWSYVLNYILTLCFLGTVPIMLYYFFKRR